MSDIPSQNNMRFWEKCILIILFIAAVHYWIRRKSYLFDQNAIVEIGRGYSGQDVQKQFKRIICELEQQYSGHIIPEHYREWIMVKSGGWIGSVYVLYASLTEYLVFTGTAIDSEGHSGRHWANISFILLSGSVQEWKEGTVQTIHYQPGDMITLTWGHASGFHWKAGSWTLEYGRGFIPFSLPFYIADSLFSTFDFIGIFKIFRAFGQGCYFELKNEIANFIASI